MALILKLIDMSGCFWIIIIIYIIQKAKLIQPLNPLCTDFTAASFMILGGIWMSGS